jgi:hypothetical protein
VARDGRLEPRPVRRFIPSVFCFPSVFIPSSVFSAGRRAGEGVPRGVARVDDRAATEQSDQDRVVVQAVEQAIDPRRAIRLQPR